jgi:hypothetical protein
MVNPSEPQASLVDLDGAAAGARIGKDSGAVDSEAAVCDDARLVGLTDAIDAATQSDATFAVEDAIEGVEMRRLEAVLDQTASPLCSSMAVDIRTLAVDIPTITDALTIPTLVDQQRLFEPVSTLPAVETLARRPLGILSAIGSLSQYAHTVDKIRLPQPKTQETFISSIFPAIERIDSWTAGIVKTLEVNAVMNAWRSVENLSSGWAGSVDSFGPYLDALNLAALNLANWTDSLPGVPSWGRIGYEALAALEALESGRYWLADAFLRKVLRVRITPYTREALWRELKRGFEQPLSSPPLWLTLEHEQAVGYLKTAVWNDAKRLWQKREMEDRLYWRSQGERPLYLEAEPWGLPESEDPCILVARQMDDRDQILETLLLNGTERDREIARLVRGGEHDRAEIRNRAGSSRLQAFERKAQRMRENGKFDA